MREFKMLKNWKKTNVTKAMVVATEPLSYEGSPGAICKTTSVPAAIVNEEMRTAPQRWRVRMGS